MDKLFLAAYGTSCRISHRRTCFDCLCCCQLIALCFAGPFCKRRSTVREHFGLPDAWLDEDDGLLASGPVDARRSLLVQHERRDAIDKRVHWLLLQLYHTEHGRLWRHHSGLKNCSLARGDGSDDRAALCGG